MPDYRVMEAGISWDKVVLNQMSKPSPDAFHEREQLTGGIITTPKCAADLLEKEFCHNGIRKISQREDANKPVILVIDELDLLCTRRQDILYSLFDWPTRQNRRCALIVLAIANTMDLPERLLHPRVASRLGFTRLTFTPYSHEQLAQIVRHRLSSLSDSFQVCRLLLLLLIVVAYAIFP
ncbi:unnamed protein product [Trichobilharzia regenti]|nr:unnamed protein product [Trichobilharzia regenti]